MSTAAHRLRPEVVARRIASFRARFGDEHLFLAWHAAFPLTLTPDLLYQIWAGFQRDVEGRLLRVPWVAVADLLLSGLCNEVGHDVEEMHLFEMDIGVRAALLGALEADPRFGQRRLHELSAFLLEYVRHQAYAHTPEPSDLATSQRWTALAYVQPGKAARELAEAFAKAGLEDRSELVRIASVVQALEPSLSGFTPLVEYAKGMAAFARKDLASALGHLSAIVIGANVQVAGIKLPFPPQVPEKTRIEPRAPTVENNSWPSRRPTTREVEFPSLPLSRPELRALLDELFLTNTDLEAFCVDHFPDVALRFASGMEVKHKQTLLLTLADHEQLTALLQARQAGSRALREPVYESPEIRALVEQLEDARRRRQALHVAKASTAGVDAQILDLRRRLREGGRLRAGDTLGDGRYLLLKVLGRGGFASAWCALDRERGEQVAIKVLHAEQAGDPVRRERFLRGARVMATLDHEAVVRVLEPGAEDGGHFYFVMALAPGGDLHRAVVNGRVRPEAALPLVLQIGDALAEAHARGIVHRDVKPANILLDGTGAPLLTDFDLVALGDTTGGTRSGAAMGSFLYMAPEQAHDAKEAGAGADVYGLGMTAVFCLYGRDLPAIVVRHPEQVIAKLPVDDAIKAVLTRAIEIEPGDRFADAGGFCEALRAAMRPSVTLVAIPAGAFWIGSRDDDPRAYDDEKPRRKVEVAAFEMGRYVVTQAQYEAVVGSNPSRKIGTDLPVTGVSWGDAVDFCNALSDREGLVRAYDRRGDDVRWNREADGYRLPTEAEWEYAARAGTETACSFGDDDARLGEYAWWIKNANHRPHPVGTLKPNPWGLFDVHGNVWEWCWDNDGPYDKATSVRWSTWCFAAAPSWPHSRGSCAPRAGSNARAGPGTRTSGSGVPGVVPASLDSGLLLAGSPPGLEARRLGPPNRPPPSRRRRPPGARSAARAGTPG